MNKNSHINQLHFWDRHYQAKSASYYFRHNDYSQKAGKDYSKDSTIAVETILNTKEVTANFSWLTIQAFSIFIDYRSNADTAKGIICQLPGLASCPGSAICEHARNIMKDLQPGNLIIFQVQKAVNRSGYVLKMADLTLRIR